MVLLPAERRIAVTGVGIICSLGRDQDEVWHQVLEGRAGIGPIRALRAAGRSFATAAEAAPVAGPKGYADAGGRLSRTDRFCLRTAGEALAQAGLFPPTDGPVSSLREFGVSIGSSTGGMREAEEVLFRAEKGGGLSRTPAGDILTGPCSHPALATARRFGLRGPCLANATACSSGAEAISLAAAAIRRGEAPGMLAGGGDSLCLLTLSGFRALRLLDPSPCRPFDRDREGLSLGEGAGLLLLERWDRALARGVSVMAEFLDSGSTCDAHHMTASDPAGGGAAAAMQLALARAGVEPEEVDYINAHGTGTAVNDASEARGIQSLFGSSSPLVPVSSSKSLFGHALGAAGGLEAVVTVLALRKQILPPTLGWRRSDPGLDLDFVPGRPRPASIRCALSNSFGFGGGNCTLVFAKGE